VRDWQEEESQLRREERARSRKEGARDLPIRGRRAGEEEERARSRKEGARDVTIRGRCEMEEGALRHDVAAHRYVVVTCGGRDFTTRGRREEESGDDK